MNALEAVTDWRPQTFGRKSPNAVLDPIVEPLWSGLRVLGAVAGEEAVLQDVEGEHLEGIAHLAEALATAARVADVIVDGYVTAEISHDGTGMLPGSDGAGSAARIVRQSFLGTRPTSDDKRLEQGRAARMPRADDPVALVLVDLLWLEGTPLLDIPLLERRRLLESVIAETDLVRHGIFVRPPIDTWVGSWRSMGFPGISFKAANSRYTPGATANDWVSIAMPRR
jgi:hypothetical protein